jgi:hypothetical protein
MALVIDVTIIVAYVGFWTEASVFRRQPML